MRQISPDLNPLQINPGKFRRLSQATDRSFPHVCDGIHRFPADVSTEARLRRWPPTPSRVVPGEWGKSARGHRGCQDIVKIYLAKVELSSLSKRPLISH